MATFLRFRAVALSLRTPAPRLDVLLPRTPSTARHASRAAPSNALPIDENIPARVVHLVDPDTGKLRDPTPLRSLLAALDRSAYFLELVRAEPPVVRMVSKVERFHATKAKKAQARAVKARRVETKEVQMTWAVAPGDAAHKLRKARAEMERGNRVELMFAKRKGQALPSPDKQHQIVDEMVKGLADVAFEWRAREMQKMLMIVYLQAHPPGTQTQTEEAPDEPEK